ncbi:vesicular glutamate transporter 3-like [Branchiostoma floridae]|uniref:Vesicular glutamate transporter 3-like n=1 Tax=Branchiostoma floridae TaxID=7739 RepID=A0A9J7MD85_BRAFL|nr:vesicular glutamate transporter 3-like [Branchiostoma floridae]
MVVFEAMILRKNKDVNKTNEQNKNKKKSMKSIPLRHILTSPAVWASILLQIAAYCWEPNILPLYFNQSFGASIELVGVLAGIPVLIFGALEPLFALVGNRLSKRLSTTIARKVLAVTGCLGVSGCLFVAAFTSNSVVATCFVSVAYGSSAARAAVADANPFDIAPRYASVLCGLCRVLCRVVGITFPLLVTTLTKNKTSQEWSRVVLIIACVFAATALFYGIFGSGELHSLKIAQTCLARYLI